MSTAILETPSVPSGDLAHDLVPEPKPFRWGAGWDVCPWCDCGTPSDDRRPCACGAEVFLVVENDAGTGSNRCRHVCKRCYRDPSRRLARSGDRIVGTYDATSGAFTPI